MVIIGILKNTFKEIKINKKIFIYLIFIIMFGIGIYTCLNFISLNMKNSAKKYYKDTNLMDLKLVSTMGFSNDDLISIKKIKEVKGTNLVKTLNTKANIKDKDCIIKVNSINKNRSKKNDDYINRLILTSGRYPSTINEGLVEEKLLKENNARLGDLITLMPENNNDLRAKKIKIVGTIKSSYNSSNSNLLNSKNNKIDYYIYVEENDFNINYYTEGYVTFKSSNKYDTYSNDYNNYIDKNKNEILNIINESTKSKYEYTASDLKNSISDLENSLNLLYLSDVPQELLNESIKDTSAELNNKKNELKSIPEPKSYVLRRNETQSFYEYELEIKKIDSISKIFSIFLFIITTLASLSIIYKFINEEKSKIGLLRAIGYNKFEVSLKYILYVLLSSIIGCTLGVLFFNKIVLKIIFICYSKFYEIPSLISYFNTKYMFKISLFEVLILLLVTIIIIVKYSTENPYKLMKKNHKEKKSKHILDKFIINNKKSFIIKILLGSFMFCLVLTLLSYKNSVNSTINNQYGKINKYDISLYINPNMTKEDLGVLESKIVKNNNIRKISKVKEMNISVKNKDISNNLVLITPYNKNTYSFIKLIDYESKNNIKLNDKGIVISSKTAKLLNVKKNDSIKILIDEKEYKVKVSNIALNYINNYAYISKDLYKKLTKKDISYNTILICLKNNDKKEKENLINEIKEDSNITSYIFTDNIKDTYKNNMKPLNSIISILMILVIIFTFCVMNCLIPANKEVYIAKKSLGIYDIKIVKNLFKELIIITIISSIIGTLLGVFLTYFIIKSCETNIFTFKLSISPLIYLLSFIIIFCFINISNFIIHINYKKINFVNELNNLN